MFWRITAESETCQCPLGDEIYEWPQTYHFVLNLTIISTDISADIYLMFEHAQR